MRPITLTMNAFELIWKRRRFRLSSLERADLF